jgi:hypothetical protein
LKIMMSLVRGQSFLPKRNALQPSSLPLSRVQNFFMKGQLEGRKVSLPVFLGRRPAEPADPELGVFYRTLLRVASSDGLRNGRWQQCERTGWLDNASYQNLIAWCWRNTKERHLIIVNFSASAAQALVLLPWDDLRGRTWRIYDIFTQNEYERSGHVMCTQGLYVDLVPWGYHILAQWQPVG